MNACFHSATIASGHRLRGVTDLRLREVLRRRLEATCGSYTGTAGVFHVADAEYKRYAASSVATAAAFRIATSASPLDR